MSISFSHYAKVIDKICFAYFGLAPEYVVQLDYLISIINKLYTDLSITLYINQEYSYLARNYVTQANPNDFAYCKEFKINPCAHTIYDFIKTSNITFPLAKTTNNNKTCLICPDAIYPSQSLTENQVNNIKSIVKGFKTIVIGSDIQPQFTKVDYRPNKDKLTMIESAGWVIGAENEYTFLAASKGIRTSLIPSGFGTDLFKLMFPGSEILWNFH